MADFFTSLLEAKRGSFASKKPADDEGTTDYTEEVGETTEDDVADTDETEEDVSEDTADATDYTEEADDDDEEMLNEEPDTTEVSEEEVDNQSADDTDEPSDAPEETNDVSDDAEGATDYTADASMDDEQSSGETGDNMSGDEAGSDTQVETNQDEPDDSTSEEGKDAGISANNVNLFEDFINLYEHVETMKKQVFKAIKKTYLVNKVYGVVGKNLTELLDDIYQYATVIFPKRNYSANLLQYNRYIEALKLNIEMLKKISSFGEQK